MDLMEHSLRPKEFLELLEFLTAKHHQALNSPFVTQVTQVLRNKQLIFILAKIKILHSQSLKY